MPDVFGDYSCQCDRGVGFVEYAGSCHAEYLQGPCEKGEQVVMKEDGAGSSGVVPLLGPLGAWFRCNSHLMIVFFPNLLYQSFFYIIIHFYII